jgi:hypothetical protein
MTMKRTSMPPAGNHDGSVEDLPDEVIQSIFRVLESARVQDMPCSEVFSRLDQYVERELRDHEAASWMPLLREHFDICPDCCDEYEALLSALEHSSRKRKRNPDGPTPGSTP